jgi:hypothetical protein
MGSSCTQKDCTVAVTGICLLSHPTPSSCPQFQPGPPQAKTEAVAAGGKSETGPGDPKATGAVRRFGPGRELGTGDAWRLMRRDYCHLVGVLGDTGAGKTCLLTSAYLMATKGTLPGFAFAGSATLSGFEERARRARVWQGAMPERLSDHTILGEARSPSLLHCALRSIKGERFDLLFTDLPGEWTTEAVKRASSADRLRFLCRADAIAIVVAADALAVDEQRHAKIQQTKLLLRRLKETLGIDQSMRLFMLLSMADRVSADLAKRGVTDLVKEATDAGFANATGLEVCAFSGDAQRIASGAGLSEVINAVVAPVHSRQLVEDDVTGSRSYLRQRL